MLAETFLRQNQWLTHYTATLPARTKEIKSTDDLSLAHGTNQYLNTTFGGVYRHQHAAIEHILRGEHTCLTTGTASGKSLAFYVAALEALQRDAQAKVIVTYPLKALGREQEERWQQALERAQVAARVGRIDGQVPMTARDDILKASRVLIMTPDIIHAWVLSHLAERSIVRLLRTTRLVIVDEVHNYAGVFGSNAAFLFRRLRHAMELLGTRPVFLGASATIADPGRHLEGSAQEFDEPQAGVSFMVSAISVH